MTRNRKAEGLVRMRGEWRDRWFDSEGKLVCDSGWYPNQVQNTNAVLLASLVKNQAGFQGALYFGFGTGLPAWDSASPTQPFSDTTLTTEVYRKAIPSSAITFRDDTTFVDIDPTPSNVIQIDTTLGIGEANGNALREFGIFGGDATAAADSGLMMNWITHGRIDKNSSVSLQRSVRFTFEVQ